MAKQIKVLIADDHAVVRAGLVAILSDEPDIDVVGEAVDGLEAADKALELKPDVILMDVYMPRCTGLEALLTIRKSIPDAKVLFLTVSDQEDDVFKALKFGARGYLLKGSAINEVVEAVRHTANGEVMLFPAVAAKIFAEFKDKGEESGNEPSLSAREQQVLQLLAEGLSNTEIAGRLFISEITVRTYLRRLMDKLHLRNRTHATAFAVRRQLAGKA